MLSRWWCERAWLPSGAVARDVLVEIDDNRITSVTPGSQPGDAQRLAGLTLPGLANTHSHAFHRALRGRTQGDRGTFWTWREQMYAVAERLDPDSYLALARATYAEMALAGITCVGEFHYLHHGPGGTPYDDPNEMSAILLRAAAEAGIRITLLDTCYLAGGIGAPLEGVQLRFGDSDANGWAARVEDLCIVDGALVGAAVHSVRAVPAAQLAPVAEWAAGKPLHVHLSEQVAENQQCLAAHGRTPTELLHDHEVLGRRSTVVHATHVSGSDIDLLGSTRTGVCLCPTTERDLADGIGPARRLAVAGSPVSLGSDSHAVIDLFEEARAVELNERLASQQRGHFTVAELIDAASLQGHRALGWGDAGRLAPGALADLVTVSLTGPRTAGSAGHEAESVLFAAGPADITDVVVSGRAVVRDGQHLLIHDVGRALTTAIEAVT
ncbi:formimidoylglutamate deiminase [soil metagenome]